MKEYTETQSILFYLTGICMGIVFGIILERNLSKKDKTKEGDKG